MTKQDRILSKVQASKELQAQIKKMNKGLNYTCITNEDFINNAVRYIEAIKEGRIICNIETVSKSGMSRTIKFLECSGDKKKGFRYLNFYNFFESMGYTPVRDHNTFRISGCGMDMIFHTNYTIIHQLHRLGFMSASQCEKLAQLTPPVIN